MRAAVSLLASLALLQNPVFRTAVDAVRIDVLVTRGGASVPGLAASDFRVLDSGVPQQIQAFSAEQSPVDLIMVFDISSSMAGQPLIDLQHAAQAAVDSLRPGDRAALTTFSQVIRRESALTGDLPALRRAIESIQADGATSLYDAVYTALESHTASDSRALMLVFTDGMDTSSWLDPLDVIERGRRSDVVIDVVSTDTSAYNSTKGSPAQLVRKWFQQEPGLFRQQFGPSLADETGGAVFTARSADLGDVFVKLLSAFRSRYVLSFVPSGVAPAGWHPLDIRLNGKKGEVRARRGYMR